MKIAICAIIKDEHRYLKEWIDYHLGIGFSHIYLFEDYGSKSHEEIVRGYADVTLQTLADVGIEEEKWNDGKTCKRQETLYNWAIEYYRDRIDWLALIDIDEFFEFEEGYSLERLVNEFNDKSGIFLYWKIITASGKVEYEDKPVRERFTDIGKPLSRDVCWTLKSFVNLNVNTKGMRTIHECYDLVNTMGIKTPRVICHKKAWLNHYFTKSWEEWCYRFTERGDLVWGHRKVEEFFEINSDMLPLKEKMMSMYEHINSRKNEWHIVIPISKGLNAVQTAKCGCTTLAYVCAEYNKEAVEYNAHTNANKYKVRDKYIEGELFSVYRDPVERWLSFYKDKCQIKQYNNYWPEYKGLLRATIEDALNATEEALINTMPYQQDQHIRRQVDTYPVDKIDIIVPLEHLDAFLESRGITPPLHQNVSKGEKPILTPEQEERIKKLYAADYELLKSPKVWKK